MSDHLLSVEALVAEEVDRRASVIDLEHVELRASVRLTCARSSMRLVLDRLPLDHVVRTIDVDDRLGLAVGAPCVDDVQVLDVPPVRSVEQSVHESADDRRLSTAVRAKDPYNAV